MLIQPLREELQHLDVSQHCLSWENLFQAPPDSKAFISKETGNRLREVFSKLTLNRMSLNYE